MEAGEIFVDARTGEMFLFFPFRTDVVGGGAAPGSEMYVLCGQVLRVGLHSRIPQIAFQR